MVEHRRQRKESGRLRHGEQLRVANAQPGEQQDGRLCHPVDMRASCVEIVEVPVLEQVHEERGSVPEQPAAGQGVVQGQCPQDHGDAPGDGHR